MPDERPAPSPYPQYSLPEKPPPRPAWFWIAIIGGCLSVIPFLLILVAIFVPQILRLGKLNKPANQTATIETLRTIGSAEMSYNAKYPEEGFACSLNVLGGNPRSGPPSSEAAQLIDPRLAATGYKSGYIFSVTNCTPMTVNHHAVNTAYRIAAIPETVGETGDVGYCINQDNVITIDPTGKWNCTEPLQ